MSGDSEALAILRKKIVSYLETSGMSYHASKDGLYATREGSTAVFMCPIEWNGYTLVQLMAPVAQDITKYDSDLTRFLLEQNSSLLFGRFSLDVPAKTVWFEHVLLGDYLDMPELLVALKMVGETADNYDEYIAEQSGGKRAMDKARELAEHT
jgi:hypothetical protein